ncbi:MAG: hypothetical protein ACRDN0_36665, partial [Trebonia sp.]
MGIEGFTTIAGQGVLHSIAPNERMGRAIGIMTGTANFIAAFGATIMGSCYSFLQIRLLLFRKKQSTGALDDGSGDGPGGCAPGYDTGAHLQ